MMQMPRQPGTISSSRALCILYTCTTIYPVYPSRECSQTLSHGSFAWCESAAYLAINVCILIDQTPGHHRYTLHTFPLVVADGMPAKVTLTPRATAQLQRSGPSLPANWSMYDEKVRTSPAHLHHQHLAP